MTSHVTALPYGPTAALFEVSDAPTAAALSAHLRRLRSTGELSIDEIVPAARTVLVECGSSDSLATTLEQAARFDHVGTSEVEGELIEIAVRYDGPDLDDIAAAAGITTDEVVRRHCGTIYTAAFSGFSPGFTYLVGLDTLLQLPRRPTPRPQVRAGSVAIAGEFTGVYPSASPGGWHLLGSTDAVLWDVQRNPPTLITPGCRVRFTDRTRW